MTTRRTQFFQREGERGSDEIELEAFLAQDGPAQDALRGRIDALMTEIEAIETR